MRDRLLPFASDYVVFDVETSGIQVGEDAVLQIGQLVTRSGKAVYQGGAYLNWYKSSVFDHNWLSNRIQSTAAIMASKGLQFRSTAAHIREEGVDPGDALTAWADTIQGAIDSGCRLVGHNIVAFDLPILCRQVHEVLGRKLLIPPEAIFDTGMFEKARQLCFEMDVRENMVEWCWRVHAQRSRVKWKLDGHCADLYKLWERSGLVSTQAHDAVADCVLTHHLYEAIRELLSLTKGTFNA